MSELNPNNIPSHVAIIMDGNGRWASNLGRDRVFGHMNGVESVRAAVKTAVKVGINHLTLYAFSTAPTPLTPINKMRMEMCTTHL